MPTTTDEQPIEVQAAKRGFRKLQVTVLLLVVGWLSTFVFNIVSASWNEHDQIQKDILKRLTKLEKENSSWDALVDQERRLRELEALTLAHDRIGRVLLQLGIPQALEEAAGERESSVADPGAFQPSKLKPIDPKLFREQYQRPMNQKGGR